MSHWPGQFCIFFLEGGGGIIISLVVLEQNTLFLFFFFFLQVLSVAQRKLSERATKQQDAIVRMNCKEVLTWFRGVIVAVLPSH